MFAFGWACYKHMRITPNIDCVVSAQETGGPASSKLNLICASCLTPPCPDMLRQRVDAIQDDEDNPEDEDKECYAGENYCLGESGLQDDEDNPRGDEDECYAGENYYLGESGRWWRKKDDCWWQC